ncbi:type II toxin-antitoxin system RelE/ParE family toxin [Emticicia sp. SJ17W-69]|uniref:type II toxin-antitoxin system RelE/ParE family toxin n=1 Tax=Emticicia sp. SJ17W-69 TaxID=3421657 RepID=UPI003EB9FE0E
MEILFRNQLLVDLYEGKKVNDNRFKSNPTIIKQYRKTVDKLQAISRIEDMYIIQSLKYEKLTGDRGGQSSVRINDQYRLIFEEIVSDKEPFQVVIFALEEISNHYH